MTISRRSFAGSNGLGLFHRVRVKGKIGYIPDTDVRVGEAEREQEAERAKETPKVKVDPVAADKPKSMAWEKDEEENVSGAPIYLTRYLGGAVSRVRYTEKFQGHVLTDQMSMFGLRMTGPGTLFDGPPLDFNFWFSLQKPEYYNVFSTGINGFLLFGDVMALMPLVNLDDWVVSYGIGLMWNFSKYRVQIRGENSDSIDFRIGADVGIGVGRRIGKSLLLRFDAKYYYEKTHYAGYTLSLQREY